jgi:glycosyltransferase involved in cell wall biosynthesis
MRNSGISIIEAMASGCPVVTSTVGACAEVAGMGRYWSIHVT